MTALALTISDIHVHQDPEGRYSLNDLHKASGGEKKHIPSYWLANQQTKELIAEIEKETTGNPVVTTEGRKGGTFVVKELVYAYAMWISPSFSLKVIRAYDALVSVASTQPALESPLISKAQAGILFNTVKTIAGESGKIRAELWSRFQNHFKLASYKDLPAEQFENAVAYLAAKREEYSGGVSMRYVSEQEIESLVQERMTALPAPAVSPLEGLLLCQVYQGQITACETLPKGAMVYNPRDTQGVIKLVAHYIPAQQLGTLIDAAVQRLESIRHNSF